MKSPLLKFFYSIWFRKRKLWKRRRRRYIYRFDAPIPFRRWVKFNKRFVSIRLTRLYFLTFQDHQFRKLFRRAAKMDGNYEQNYLCFLESRALAICYRLNFSPNLFWLLRFIRAGRQIFLETRSIRLINLLIPIGKMLTINKKWHYKFSHLIKKRIKFRLLLFPTPKFIYSCYKLFFFYLLRNPRRSDLVYPFNIDLQRITGYY